MALFYIYTLRNTLILLPDTNRLSYPLVGNQWPLGFIWVYGIALLVIAYCTPGTGDDGDSVMHYLFAHYAFAHPENLLDHWAKPFFTLLAAPLAQFGFDGIQTFNVLCTCVALWATWQSAKLLKLPNAGFVVLFMAGMPLYTTLTLSGLTELLFAALLSVALLLLIKKKLIWAVLITGLLPFVRSEGWILDIVIIGYLLLNHYWKAIPLIAVGHILYMTVGWLVHGDFWWPFTQNPYAHIESPYGQGSWFHFVPKLIYLVGVPLYILLVAGVFASMFRVFKQRSTLKDVISIIILGGFGAFFLAHTVFWAMGTVNSAGLLRVFLAVVPLMGLLTLIGFNRIFQFYRLSGFRLIRVAKYLMVVYVLVFPFTPNGAALHWKDFQLRPYQKMAIEIGSAVKALPLYEEAIVYYAYPYFSMVLGLDPFDLGSRRAHMYGLQNHPMDRAAIVIWDGHFAVTDLGISEDQMEQYDWLSAGLIKREVHDEQRNEFRVFWYNPKP